ncbi:MAG: hypothetical protein NC489_42035 [Ruminococcus flavefaciens]|nr:hypothetical protein [Ruminococcus flavefaciens]
MNARELQTALVDDLDALFKDRPFKTPKKTMEAPKAYPQSLPPQDARSEDDPFPYIIVRLDHGGVDTQTDPHKVTVLLIIGIFDDGTLDFREPPPAAGEWDNRNFGPTALLEVIERIQEHYEKRPALEGGKFYFDGPFHWVVQDETRSWPYYIGACDLTFTLAAPRKERSKFV